MLRWLMVLAVLAGCEGRTAAPEGSGASHWLLPCVADADCGALSCLCGQCALTCDDGACPLGVCVADACGAEALCRAADDDAAQVDESIDQAEMRGEPVDDLEMEGEEPPFEVDEAWADGPLVGADNPRGVWQFHRPSPVDANVLELRADGTFIFTLGGCDAVDCAWGTWARDGNEIWLRPPDDELSFRWPDEFAMHAVDAVHLSARADGVVARVTAPDRESFEQTWLNQGLAVDCVDWSTGVSDAPAEPEHCHSPAYPDL